MSKEFDPRGVQSYGEEGEFSWPDKERANYDDVDFGIGETGDNDVGSDEEE